MAAVMAGVVLASCKKEEKKDTGAYNEAQENKGRKSLVDNVLEEELSFDVYIDSLIRVTCTDVRLLATKTYITDWINELSQEFNCMGELTEEDGNYMLYLAQMTENFAQMEQMDSCLYYYELFWNYYNNKMDPCNRAYSCEPLVYNGTLYEVALESVNERRQKAVNVITEIEADFPDYAYLSEEEKQELLSVAFFLNMEPSFLPQQNPYTLCVDRANKICAAEIAAASALYTWNLVKCSALVFPVGIGACMAATSAAYGISVATAMHTRNVEIENCEYRYGNN